MEEELRELLKNLDTQIDGVESYLRQLVEMGNRPGMKTSGFRIGTMLRAYPQVELDTTIPLMRSNLQKIEDEIDFTLWGAESKE